jgi:hypothetical protein
MGFGDATNAPEVFQEDTVFHIHRHPPTDRIFHKVALSACTVKTLMTAFDSAIPARTSLSPFSDLTILSS